MCPMEGSTENIGFLGMRDREQGITGIGHDSRDEALHPVRVLLEGLHGEDVAVEGGFRVAVLLAD